MLMIIGLVICCALLAGLVFCGGSRRAADILFGLATYGSLGLVLVVLYAGSFLVLPQVFGLQTDNLSTELFTFNIVLVLALALIAQPLKSLFARWVEKVFYRRNYNAQQIVDRLTQLSVRSKDIDTLLAAYLREFMDIFHSSFVAVVFKDSYHHPRAVGQYANDCLKYDYVSRLDSKRPMAHGIAEVIPLEASSQPIGYLVIGVGHDGRRYRENDVALFRVLGSELSIALLNIFRLEEIRRFASTLESEVNDATAKLRHTNEQLRSLDATKDEFVGMASHQLRTPLTSVKGYLSMVLEGDAGEITDAQRQLLQEAFTSSERMVHLIGDFLNVNRLQTGKFVIDRTLVDLAKLVSEEVANVSQVASVHKVAVKYRKPSRFPLLYLDENKIRQVVMNLIDNAIYYSPEADSIKVSLSIEDGDAVLKVIDKGMGVAKSEQKRLFTKFFRAENARKQRPDGTGIGLYLARKVVGGHGGRIIFESELGKGSTFGFRLPIASLELSPDRSVDEPKPPATSTKKP